MQKISILLILAGSIFSKVSYGQSKSHHVNSLSTLLQQSIARQPFRQRLDNSQLGIEISRAQRLPSLSAYANQSYGRSTLPQNHWSSDIGLKISESIYDNGKTANQILITSLSADAEKLQIILDKDDISLDVALKYLRIAYLLQKKELLIIQKAAYEKQFKFSDIQYKQGFKNRKDYLKSKSQRQRSVANLKSNEAEVTQLKAELRGLVGSEEAVQTASYTFTDFEILFKDFPQNTDSSIKEQIATKTTEKLQSQLQFEKRQKTWPALDFNIEGGYQVYDYLPNYSDKTDGLYYRASLGISYTFWDWRIAQREILEKTNDFEIQKSKLQNDLINYRAEIESLKAQLLEVTDNQKLANEIVELEKGNYSLLENEFKQGRTSYFELSYGLNDLYIAELDLLDNKYRRYFLAATYYARLGELYDTLVH